MGSLWLNLFGVTSDLNMVTHWSPRYTATLFSVEKAIHFICYYEGKRLHIRSPWLEESQLMEFYICKPKPGQKEVQIICNERGHPTFSVSLFTLWSRAGMGWITTVTVIFLELWFCVSSWYFLEVESVALFLHCKHFHVSQAPHLHHCTCMYANCISIEIIWKLTRDSLWWWWWCVEASNHVSTDQQLRAETPISSLFLPSSQLLIIPWFFFTEVPLWLVWGKLESSHVTYSGFSSNYIVIFIVYIWWSLKLPSDLLPWYLPSVSHIVTHFVLVVMFSCTESTLWSGMKLDFWFGFQFNGKTRVSTVMSP